MDASYTSRDIAIILSSWTPPEPNSDVTILSTSPSLCIGVLPGSKFQGMNAMNPPVSSCSLAISKKWSAMSDVVSACPYIMVADDDSPSECASLIMRSQSELEIFLGLMTSLTSSFSISAPAPGTDCSPASLSRESTSAVDDRSTRATMSISDGESACTPTPG